MLEICCGWFWVVFVLQAEAQLLLCLSTTVVVLQPAKRAPLKTSFSLRRDSVVKLLM
jgi:hypothetical protein